MTTSTPVRAIKARARSRADQTVARRAIEEPPAPPATRSPRVEATARPAAANETAFVGPRIGKPETQLMLSFVATAAIVFVFTVLLPLLLRLVRNF